MAAQRVVFGTSGHRGSSLNRTFNEAHVLAITQAICQCRRAHGVNGPLFMGIDTHALSEPAFRSALEVLAGNGVNVMIAAAGEFTPTPAVSHAILAYNRGRAPNVDLADGIVVAPSHNPPDDGGFKYNPANGGPAPASVTSWIQAAANEILENGLANVRRIPFDRARRANTAHEHDYLAAYVQDLGSVVDLETVRASGIHIGVDPLGGAGVHYWPRIADEYRLNLTVVSEEVDPTFRFMTRDSDGRIRMDPSSPYAMQRLIGMKSRFDIAFACDTDHDRHGVVTHGAGLLPPNHYLVAMIDYLFPHRLRWGTSAAVGKTVVSSALIDRVVSLHGRTLYEVPVGFKWYAEGLFDGSLVFAGEESAGAVLSRFDGSVWTTDKDGLVPGLLAAEITARTGRDPGEHYADLTRALGETWAERTEWPAMAKQKRALERASPSDVTVSRLAGEPVIAVISRASGNGAALGGLKVQSANGWFAVRPSGTEDVYRLYAESFLGPGHL